MANPQPTDSHLRLAVAIQDELITGDFTKRQYKAINLILRASWACGKKYAIIPKYTRYFCACGIYKQDIKKTLETLVKNKVIFWDKDTNVFEFNKNFEEWRISYHPDANKSLIKELTHLNLSNKQNTYSVSETRTESENNTYSVSNKSLLTEAENADTEQETGGPITSIITSNYNDYFEILKKVENYLFDIKKDEAMLCGLMDKYPNIDLMEALKDWAVYKLDKALTKGSSPRSQINTWIKKGIEFGKYKKEVPQADYDKYSHLTEQRIDFDLQEAAK